MSHPAGPRGDPIGYGGALPAPPWPNGARAWGKVCINHEEGAERTILDDDAGSEHRIPDFAATRRIGARDLNIESA